MNTAVYKRDMKPKGGLASRVVRAFVTGLKSLDFDVEERNEKNYRRSELAVIFGQYKSIFHSKTVAKRRIFEK